MKKIFLLKMYSICYFNHLTKSDEGHLEFFVLKI